ncbi:50S ribosomal protein L18 [Candidatus Woesearchaeota archaeon]|nr:50S ribosomal protein L18 [Candidatus Woesearchaeota archaeon]
MATGLNYIVGFRRKREELTDYRKRLNLLRSHTPRMVVRKSLKHLSLQLIDYAPEGDKVLVSAHTRELAKHGWKAGTDNLSAAYLCGILLAKKAKAKKIAKAIADLGMYPSVKGNKLYATIKGAIDGGLQIPFDVAFAPDMKRLRGEHIAAWAGHVKKDAKKHPHQFTLYTKHGLQPEQLPQHVDDIKKKLMS